MAMDRGAAKRRSSMQNHPYTLIGKYRVQGHAARRHDGMWQGSATLVWEDGGATKTRTDHYDRACLTEEEAVQHAVQQVYIRVKDGVY
jgi:hypothetical protein